MNKKSLKSVLKYWQEIVFVISIGFILVPQIILNMPMLFRFKFFYGALFLLLICLIGQLFWKNVILGRCLAIIFTLACGYMSLGYLIDKEGHDIQIIHETILVFFLFAGLTATAILMFRKYINTDRQADNVTA